MLFIHVTESLWTWKGLFVRGSLYTVLPSFMARRFYSLDVPDICSMFPNPSPSRLLDSSACFPSTGGVPSCSIPRPGGKASLDPSTAFGVVSATSCRTTRCSCSPLHSAPRRPIADEAAVFGCLRRPTSTKPAPLNLCEALLVSGAVTARENQKREIERAVTQRCRTCCYVMLLFNCHCVDFEPKLSCCLWNVTASPDLFNCWFYCNASSVY